MDTVIIKGLTVFAYHGVNPEEKENGQRFIIDCELYTDLSKAADSDNVADTVSYSAAIKTIKTAFSAKKYDLIEAAAQACINALLEKYERLEGLEITVYKPDAPISSDFENVGVRIRKMR